MVIISPGFELIAREPGFVVVHKDPGLDFHDCDGRMGLCSLVRDRLQARVFPVHRLDKATSGLLLLARSREWAAALAGLFRERAVQKYYIALSDLTPGKKQGLVQGDMVRSRRGSWKLARSMERPARTRFLSWSVRPGMRLFVLKPMSGRTHQLRVAMKSLGAPILGDSLYHPIVPDWPDRMYLHAHTLRFSLGGQNFAYACPPRSGDMFLEDATQSMLQALGPLEGLAWPAQP
ncbi:pseudouridine synthase [Desulfomicrobium baculatum]|uniref:pseudouridine synthase n=1 Tax=Desulfomicrobium baculatum TaxID=899 RepID=UPI00019E2411|nr:pseudouridine synthase [Desulfomicrobium baculatum]